MHHTSCNPRHIGQIVIAEPRVVKIKVGWVAVISFGMGDLALEVSIQQYYSDTMGPIDVLGPVGSLGELIYATAKLAGQLRRLARRVRTAEKDIRQFASELSMFSFASDRACAYILEHYSSKTKLVTLSIVEEEEFLRDAEESAKYIMDNVEKIKPRMRSMKSSSTIDLSLISKIKWAKRKSEVRDLTFNMGALKTTLTLLMITVVYEVQRQQNEAPEAL